MEYQVPRHADPAIYPQVANCVQYFNHFFFQYIPEDLPCWIAGGAVRDYFSTGRMTDSDVDFFLPDRKCMCRLLLILRKRFKFKCYLITKNAIKGNGFIGKEKIDIDIVKLPFEDKLKTIDTFDFTVCCFAVDRKECVYHPSAPFDLLRKRLVINALPMPVSTLQRMQKYLKRDYWICNGGMVEIAKALGNVDFTNPQQNNIEFYPDGSPRIVRID
jgi:hypothetical protein